MSTTPELLRAVGTLIERAQTLDFRVPEDTGVVSLDESDLALLIDLMTQAMDLGGAFLDRFEAADPTLDPTGSAAESGPRAADVADLAFFARNQIRETAKALAQARGTGNIWTVLAQADGAQRRLLKAMIALESAARENAGLETIERRWVVIEESLEIRQVYGQFHRAILRDGDPDADELRARLRDAARRIAILRDRTIYPYLRLDDRRQIHLLHKRIAAFLERDGSDDKSGERLWHDLVGFARLLRLVNNRQELVQHDQAMITRARTLLFANGSPPEHVPPALLRGLETMVGRDEELDRVLLGARPVATAQLRAPLDRLHRSIR